MDNSQVNLRRQLSRGASVVSDLTSDEREDDDIDSPSRAGQDPSQRTASRNIPPPSPWDHNSPGFPEHNHLRPPTSGDQRHQYNAIPKEQSIPSYPSSAQHAPRRYHVLAYWRWEIASLMLAIGLIMATFIILVELDNQVVPDWPLGISLGALLSVIATLLQAAVTAVLAQIISQSKWDWFTARDRPLQHLQTFDAGSRGGLGLVRLFFLVVKGGSVVPTVAIVLMVIAFAIGPFVQQAISTVPCQVVVDGVAPSLPYAHYVPRHNIWPLRLKAGSVWDPDTDTIASVYNVLTNPTSLENQNVTITSCVTGNCTFTDGDPRDAAAPLSSAAVEEPTFTTMGLCSSCKDVSDLVWRWSKEDNTLNPIYGLPNGVSIRYSQGGIGTWVNVTAYENLDWLQVLLPPELARVSRWAVANVTVLTTTTVGCDNPQNHRSYSGDFECTGPGGNPGVKAKTATGVVASVCSLYPCMRTYNVSVENNNVHEVLLSSVAVVPDLSTETNMARASGIPLAMLDARSVTQYDYAGVHSPCRVDGSIYTDDNFSSAPSTTRLALFQNLTDAPFRNFSAPEQCIYRHSGAWASVLSNLLRGSIFNGQCQPSETDQTRLDCSAAVSVQTNCSSFTTSPAADLSIGVGKFMNILYADGNATASSIEAFFESFAAGMTTKYRTLFGSSIPPNSSALRAVLPEGQVSGVAFQTTICTAWTWQWLILPVFVVLALSVLLLTVLIRSWRMQNIRPVWKDHALPAVFYRERFKARDGTAPAGLEPNAAATQAREASASDETLEIDEMENLAKNMPVRFMWTQPEMQEAKRSEAPGEVGHGANFFYGEGMPSANHQGGPPRRSLDVDSLMIVEGANGNR